MIIMPKTKRIPKMVSTHFKSLDWYLFKIIGKENLIIIIIFILILIYIENIPKDPAAIKKMAFSREES